MKFYRLKYGIASGYFNPLSGHHIDYLNSAITDLDLDYLTVIVNNDHQVKVRNKIPFQNEQERIKILRVLKGVDEVVLSIDQDISVSNTLRKIINNISDRYVYDFFFVNGGDVNENNCLEIDVCRELGITPVFGVGGIEKMGSSSQTIKKAYEYIKTNHKND